MQNNAAMRSNILMLMFSLRGWSLCVSCFIMFTEGCAVRGGKYYIGNANIHKNRFLFLLLNVIYVWLQSMSSTFMIKIAELVLVKQRDTLYELGLISANPHKPG